MPRSQVSYGETKDSTVANNGLFLSSRIAEAEWIEDRLVPFASCVTAIVPTGFEAYVRIFHPATERHDGNERIRWADVAARSGRTTHRLAQFHAINRPLGGGAETAHSPSPGTLHPDLLEALCATLAEHTTGQQSCFFCLWDGYGWLFPERNASETCTFNQGGFAGAPLDLPASVESIPAHLRRARSAEERVRLPGRDYLLFEGPLAGATELGNQMPQSPNLFWPEDRGWCVASEIDLFCTLIGGTIELAECLTANPALEAWRVSSDDPISYDSDKINI